MDNSSIFFFDRMKGIESAGSEVDVIHEHYSGKVIEDIKEGSEVSNFDKVVVFADGSKSYIKLNCDENNDCEVEELE